MRFLILLFPVMVLAQPNFSINESEYRRRVDNLFNLRELLLDRGLRNTNIGEFKNDIVRNKNLALLQQLEAEELVRRNEKRNPNRERGLLLNEEKYLAQKYLKTLDINSLTTEEKKKEFFKAIKYLLEEI